MPLLLLVGWLPLTGSAWAQSTAGEQKNRFIDLTVGLGVNAHFATSAANYINLVAQPWPGQKVDIITSAPEFTLVGECQLSDEWSAGVEYSLLLKSYSLDDRSGFSRSDISYNVHMPTILVHRLLFGEGFRIKAGGGIGYHAVTFKQHFQAVGTEEALSTSGVGFKLEAVGNTKFDETFYGSIGIDLRWDFLGTLKRRDPAPAADRSTGELPSMTLFNAGITFGLTFQLQ